ncbi:MAG: ABC transporter substrate-binding protein [Treponema sp.]|jgi:iron complex transport system substrate-binding protein|nr:ABC transporter substrate-binding protein [Treponema sp.]
MNILPTVIRQRRASEKGNGEVVPNHGAKRPWLAAALLVLFAVLVFSGRQAGKTAEPPEPAAAPAAPQTAVSPGRIISASPSITEIIIGLGLGSRIIAADQYSLPLLPSGPQAIDFFYPDQEFILGLEPDILISTEVNTQGAADNPFKLLEDFGIRCFYIPTSTSVAEIKRDIRAIAAELGLSARGEELVAVMEREIKEVADIGNRLNADPAFTKKTVYMEISPFPYPYSTGRGTFMNEMIEIIGARNIFSDVSGWIAPAAEAILERNPDVILTNVNFTDDPVGEIMTRPGFDTVTAVREAQVYVIDADSSSRPSQHITLALRQMAQAVYPGEYATLGGN